MNRTIPDTRCQVKHNPLTRWLFDGADEDTLSDTWMRDRLPDYVAYTVRQLDQGRVVTDSAEMRRRAFWQAQDAKTPRLVKDNLREMRRSER